MLLKVSFNAAAGLKLHGHQTSTSNSDAKTSDKNLQLIACANLFKCPFKF